MYFLYLLENQNSLHLPVAFAILFGNSEQRNTLQTIAHLIQNTVLVIQFWSVKYSTVTVGYEKNSRHVIPYHSNEANDYNGIVWKWNLHENNPLQNSFKHIQHCIQLFEFYSISIILFLKNNLTNICCKISKIGMNIWMVYICNMNNSGKYSMIGWEEGECTLQCWPKSSEICDCSRPF